MSINGRTLPSLGGVALIFCCATLLPAATLVRGPYLQSGASSSIIVRWRTAEPATSRVRYGPSPTVLNNLVSDETPRAEHELLLTGLASDSKYFYSIEAGDGVLAAGADYFFVTAPIRAKPTRIWVLGDAGTQFPAQEAVRDAYYAFTGARHTDLWLMLGDNAYLTGADSEYQGAVFDTYPEMLRKSVLWPTLGNHDTAQDPVTADDIPYFLNFSLPTAGEAGGVPSGTEKYYSFNYGNIHLICLDSMSSDRSSNGTMCAWLRADLAATPSEWIFAFWHHPPYSKGSHDSDAEFELIEMRQNVLPILEASGVDLVLCGHSHSYERSLLLHGHYGDSSTLVPEMIQSSGSGREAENAAYRKGGMDGPGAVYVVAGSSGQIGGGALSHPAMFIALNELGSVVLDVDGPRLDATFLRENGTVGDTFTILKNGAPGRTRIVSYSKRGVLISFTWTAQPGSVYYVERSRSLELSNWEVISPPITSPGETATWTTPIEPDPHLFYRVSYFP
ncbi:MAG: metallophosphoesterase family protein [Verrucomicrobia subdivision 3 bacterium]|nr:metallophosphoesterase family protein [Limisphaerales bacterium]